MKKSLLSFFTLLTSATVAYAAGDGTKENPYTQEDLVSVNPARDTECWVKGYIVGWNSGPGTFNPTVRFSADGSNDNLALALTPDGTDAKKMIYISNNACEEIRLSTHPECLGKQIAVKGRVAFLVNWGCDLSKNSGTDYYFIEEGGDTPGDDTPGTDGDGTEANPYTVAGIRAASGFDWSDEVWVEGYLVGAAASWGLNDVVFGKTGEDVKTYKSVVIADDKDCTDKDLVFCLAYAREEQPLLNIMENPGQMYKKFVVKVTGLMSDNNNAAYETLEVKELSGGSGIVGVEADVNAPVEYFNLQGMPVGADNLRSGNVYIRRQGGSVTKVLVK